MTDVFPGRKGININCTIVRNDERASRAAGRRTVQTSCPNAPIVRSTAFLLSTGYDREFFADSNSPSRVALYVAPTLFLQLKKFVQRINNGRRTTVSKCWVYLATNKASTWRYSRSWETRPSFSPFPLSLVSLSFSVILALSIRLLLSLLARIAATLNDFATHYERNVPHIRREIKVLRRCASPRSRGLGPDFFLRPFALPLSVALSNCLRL